MKKLILTLIIGIFLIGGIFALSFSIKNDFDKKVDSINTITICQKDNEKAVKNNKCEELNLKYEPLNISKTDYFNMNSGGIIKFSNGN